MRLLGVSRQLVANWHFQDSPPLGGSLSVSDTWVWLAGGPEDYSWLLSAFCHLATSRHTGQQAPFSLTACVHWAVGQDSTKQVTLVSCGSKERKGQTGWLLDEITEDWKDPCGYNWELQPTIEQEGDQPNNCDTPSVVKHLEHFESSPQISRESTVEVECHISSRKKSIKSGKKLQQ